MIVNAMTIDVEDYFQVSAFDGVVPRERWDASRAASSPTPSACSRSSTSARCTARSSCSAGSPSAIPRSCGDRRRGHELASHGYAHRLVYDQTPDAFRDDVRRAKALLEQIGGVAVRGYRAPSFSVTPRSLLGARRAGRGRLRYDASIFPIRHDRYGIPDAPRHPYVERAAAGAITEAPASTVRSGR